MVKFKGVHIDIGGPLRVSDIEMHEAEDQAFRKYYGFDLDFLEPMESWQLYGMFSAKGYLGLVEAALAIMRSGRSFSDYLSDDDPIAVLKAAVYAHNKPGERKKREATARAAKDYYMAHQSRRLAEGVKEGLELMEEADIRMSVITSVVTPDAVKWVREMGLSDYLRKELIMGNSPEGATKQDEKIPNLLTATTTMGLEPEKTLYVADTRGDMQAALAAGTAIGMIRKGMTPPALFEKYLKEMPGFVKERNYFEFEDLEEAAWFVT